MLSGMSETILVGYDGQEPSERALDRAIETVKTAGGKVIVVVAEQMPPVAYEATTPFGPAYDASMFELAQAPLLDPDKPLGGVQEIIDNAMQKLTDAGVSSESSWGIGDPAQVIIDAARKYGATKIMVGAHPHGFFARVFSEDIGAEVAEEVQCDVVVVD